MTFCYVMLYKICVGQIQPSKLVQDHANYKVPTQQHELDATDKRIDLA